MILQALVKEYENLAENNLVPKRGWCQAKVSYAIDLNPNGKIKEIYPLKTEQTSGKKKVFLPVAKSVPEMVTRSSGVAANFLCDNVKYMLGIDQNGTNARVQECFQAAKEKHLALLKNVDEPMANAICNFFNLWNPETAYDNACVREKSDELNEGGNVIFCMGNDFAQDNDTIKKIWDNYVVHQTENTNDGICLATGEKTEIARIHRGIKGVPGAQTSGAALVSFNAPAFESYGKEQSYNAPVGKYAEFAYTTALNYLLSNRDKTFQLGDSMVVYWAENGMEEYQKTFSFVMNPHIDNEEQLQRIFDSLKKSRYVDVDNVQMDFEQSFYILCLAPNAARLSVRFFYQNTFGDILKNIKEHYKRLDIVKPLWVEKKYLSVYELLRETVNPYLGTDGIKPFVDVCKEEKKGIFILVKTSNPSSGEFQDRMIDGRPLYEWVGEKVAEWGADCMGDSYSYVGAVVGATYPEQGKILRKVMPKSFILVPGYGAQGGKGADLVHFFNEDGLGAIVNSSRGIICAYKQDKYKDMGITAENFADASRKAVEDMIEDISGALANR